MFNIGPLEIAVIALIALVVVGPKRLPELGKTIGKGMREFRKAQDELKRSVDLGLDDPEETPPTFREERFTNKRRSPRRDDTPETDEAPGDEPADGVEVTTAAAKSAEPASEPGDDPADEGATDDAAKER